MRLSEYASTRKTRGSYKMPRSVQQSIPIDRIYADGVWQSENVFSLMWQISDINYAMQSDAAKQNILTQLGTVYAGIPADCWMQVCIVSQRMDEKAFARDVLYHRENDGFDALRAERNRQIKANARENGNVVQHKYIIVSTNKPGVKEARERFVQVQGHLLSAFSALECAVTPLDNRARLEVLHKFFRISEEGRFNFEFDNCAKLGQDFRDSIAPDCIRFCKKHIEIEDFYAKCMTISEYPQQLDDKFISALLQQVPYIVLSIDIEPVETEDAFKEIDNAQMKTDAEKVRFNKKSVENLDFTSSVPQRTQEQDRIIASIRKEMTENDQQMFLSLLTVTYFADTLEDLALETDALKTTAANYNCRFTELYFQQERAFNTAMPYGLHELLSDEMRPTLLALCGGIGIIEDGELCWPLPGYTYISCNFGDDDAYGNSGHRGTDIPAPEGTPILAAHSGTVIISGWNNSYGNQVLLDNGAGLSTRYAHMTAAAVSAGETVTAGQVIGYVGNTGDSTGFHLHFEVMQNGVRVNPLDAVTPQ